MKAFSAEIHYASVVANIDKRKIRNVVRKTLIEREKDMFVKDVNIQK